MPTTFTLHIDWDRSGTWIDETAYLRRARIRAGFARPGDPVADVGRCDLTLDNTTGRFSPGNTEGLLYGKLLPRRPVKLSATDGVTTWVLFRGFIEHLAPDAGHWGSGLCTILCVDGIALLARQRISTAHADSQDVDQAVAALVSGVYTPPATAYSDNGDSLTHVGRAWTPEHTTAHDALRDIASAVYGRFFVARDGTATFLTRTDLQDPSISAAATIGDAITAPYSAQVRATQPTHLIGYWPLWEATGGTAQDYSGNGRDLTASGITWGQPGIGDGNTGAGFDGVNDAITGLETALSSAFDGNTGTALVWARVSDVAVWGDGSQDAVLSFCGSVGHLSVIKITNNRLLYVFPANKSRAATISPHEDWLCLAWTWDTAAGEGIAYLNGVQQGADVTGLTAWTGALNNGSGIGTYYGGSPWSGAIAHVAVWDTVLTPAEIAALAQV